MAPFDRLHTTSYWRSIVTVVLSCIFSEIKPDIGRKSQFFDTLPAFYAPVMEVLIGILPQYV